MSRSRHHPRVRLCTDARENARQAVASWLRWRERGSQLAREVALWRDDLAADEAERVRVAGIEWVMLERE